MCIKITGDLNPSCDALSKRGGFGKKVYIGFIDEIESITFGTGNEITALTMKNGKKLFKYSGYKGRNSAGLDGNFSDILNLRNHVVNLALFAKSAAELNSIDELVDSKDMFVIVESNNKTFEVYGISKDGELDNYGLNPTAFNRPQAAGMTDDNAYQITLSGEVPNIEILLNLTDFDTTKTTLETTLTTEAA
ncbi:hypothetical protein [Croceimicrobium sp.]|uniref:hypothetical protein n=1 Tax=Croceimicrobium sp. TaxID=2828340 RepID=UPI003BABE0B6